MFSKNTTEEMSCPPCVTHQGRGMSVDPIADDISLYLLVEVGGLLLFTPVNYHFPFLELINNLLIDALRLSQILFVFAFSPSGFDDPDLISYF